jgi:hypothetical protein
MAGWRKSHNDELRNLYFSPDLIREVKCRLMGGACSTHARYYRQVCNILAGKPDDYYLGDIGVDGKVILKLIERNVM